MTAPRLSARLAGVLDELPLRPGLRVLEIGGGTGALARAVAPRVAPDGCVLMVDRSATAVRQALASGEAEVAGGWLRVRRAAVEDLVPEPGEAPYDLVVAVRVGALDGRYPELGARAADRLAAMTVPGAPVLVGDGAPLRVLDLDDLRRTGTSRA